MNQDRRGKSILAAVMGSTYPFGMVQAMTAQQPAHVIVDEWPNLATMQSVDYAAIERQIAESFGMPAFMLDSFPSGVVGGRLSSTLVDQANRLRDKRGLDKWIRTAEAYGFRGELPERYAHEAERRQIARREWEWLASQRETRPAPEVD